MSDPCPKPEGLLGQMECCQSALEPVACSPLHWGPQSPPHLDGVVGHGWIEVSEQILDFDRESRESLGRERVAHGWAAAQLTGMDRLCGRIQPPSLHWLLTWLWAVGSRVQVGKSGSVGTGLQFSNLRVHFRGMESGWPGQVPWHMVFFGSLRDPEICFQPGRQWHV